jgi:cell division protein FtsN
VGAFGDPERAVALKREIARYYPEAVVDSDGTWHRVQIGAFDDREHAESLRRELTVIGMQAVVVSAH